MQQSIILGVKRSKGTLDNGRSYDSTKLYVQTPMKESDDQMGYSVSELTWGDSTNFDKFKDCKFPLQAGINYELVTNGKTNGNDLIITDVKIPVQVQGIQDVKKA